MKKLLCALALSCALSLSAFAGGTEHPGNPTPPAGQSTTTFPLTTLALNLYNLVNLF